MELHTAAKKVVIVYMSCMYIVQCIPLGVYHIDVCVCILYSVYLWVLRWPFTRRNQVNPLGKSLLLILWRYRTC